MQNETFLRLGVFLGLFVVLALAEAMLPRRPSIRMGRWPINWAMIILDSITLRIMAIAVPLLAVGAALEASHRGIGLFNHTTLPSWIEVLLAIIILDFFIWLQHLITHKVPFLWRFHQVHHADPEMDVTTAIRFHPVEIALSAGFKIGLVYVFGPSAVAVILFEVLLNGTAMFNHANLRLPIPLDRVVRRVLVTPDMHRVHHSVYREETDSNYGFSLSLWDRLFGTYIAQPKDGHTGMRIGLLGEYAKPKGFIHALMMPFRKGR
ncbi:sterol desaturase family protein [Falsihalocynthiibacter sp. S25ZX9]|uniref:sterol desaturase family protein n=1 Tax=Falsihalocynthiibacter sp. S25ZX9 TaxID=3240870 RepID=UPI00350F753C